MRTSEEMLRAIRYRINQLETFNTQLIDINQENDEDLLHVYMENEARLSELNSLLEYLIGT